MESPGNVTSLDIGICQFVKGIQMVGLPLGLDVVDCLVHGLKVTKTTMFQKNWGNYFQNLLFHLLCPAAHGINRSQLA